MNLVIGWTCAVCCSERHSDRDATVLHTLQHAGGPEGIHGERGTNRAVLVSSAVFINFMT